VTNITASRDRTWHELACATCTETLAKKPALPVARRATNTGRRSEERIGQEPKRVISLVISHVEPPDRRRDEDGPRASPDASIPVPILLG